MPREKTTKLEIQDRINTFMELMKYAPNNEENAALYQSLQEKMDALNAFFRSQEPEHEQDPPRPFTKEQQENLTRLYNEAIEAAQKLGEAPPKSPSERSVQDIARAMEKLLKRDRDVVRSVDTRYGLSLGTLVTEARTDYVDMGDPENVTVKNGIKERMPIEFTDADGNVRRGFFTKARKVLDDEEMDAFKEQKIAEIPNLPGYKDMLRKFVKYADLNAVATYTKTLPPVFDEDMARSLLLSPFLCELSTLKRNKENPLQWDGDPEEVREMQAAETMAESPAFLRFFHDFFLEVQRAVQYNDTAIQMLNLEVGDSLEHRGSAMSKVAELVGASSLIARGTPMKLRLGDEELEGTFTEEAPGLDVRGQKHDSPLFSVEQDKLTDPKVVRQLSDLMVLDYLCNNQPRQADHMIYQFDNNGKLVSVRGIDNDSSFKVPDSQEGVSGDFLSMNKVNPQEMLVISEDMANHIMNLSEESLRFTLKTSKLSEEAVNASCERLLDLQNRILEGASYFENKPMGVEPGKLRVVKDSDFAQLSVRELVFKPKKENMLTTDDEPRNTPLAKVFNLQKNAWLFFKDEHGFLPNQIERHPELLQQETQAKPEKFAKGRLIEQNINSVGLFHRLMTDELELHKLEAAKVADALKKASTLVKSSELKTAAEKVKTFSDKLAKLKAESKLPELAKVTALGKAAFEACNNLVTELGRTQPLTEQLSKIMQVAKLSEKAIGQKYAAFCHVQGEKVMTNVLAARLMLKQAQKGLEAEFNKAKPDAAKLQQYFAMERMAAELQSRPKDGLFNEAAAPGILKALAASPEVKQQAADYRLRLGQNALRFTQTLSSKRLFFEPELMTERGALKLSKPHGRCGLSSERTALNSLAICVLLRDGHHLRDILDPSKLQQERLQAGRDVLEMYDAVEDGTLASMSAELLMTGMETIMQQVNASMREMSSINGQECRKPRNAYLFAVAGLLQDMGQELEREDIKNKAELLESPERVEDMLNRQAGGNKMLDALFKGERDLMLLSEGKVVSFDKTYSVDEEWARTQDAPDEQIRITVLENAMTGAFAQRFMSNIKRGSKFDFFSEFKKDKPRMKEMEGLLNTLLEVTDLADSFKNQLKGDVPFNAINLARGLVNGKLDLSKEVTLDQNNQPGLNDISDKLNTIPRRDKVPQVRQPQRGNSGGAEPTNDPVLERAFEASKYEGYYFQPQYFFRPEKRKENRWPRVTKDGRLGLSTTRSALNALSVCFLLMNGHSLQDILDPTKLQKDRFEAGDAILEAYNTMSDDSFAALCANLLMSGLELTLKQVNKTVNSMPEVTMQELCKPQNAYLFGAFTLLQDMGQELGRSMITEKAKQLEGEDQYKELINCQAGCAYVLDTLLRGTKQLALLAQGRIDNGIGNESLEAFIKEKGQEAPDRINERVRNIVKGCATEKLFRDKKKKKSFDFIRECRFGGPLLTDINEAMNTIEMSDNVNDSITAHVKGDVLYNTKTLAKGLLNRTIDIGKNITITKNREVVLSDLKPTLNKAPRRKEAPAPRQKAPLRGGISNI